MKPSKPCSPGETSMKAKLLFSDIDPFFKGVTVHVIILQGYWFRLNDVSECPLRKKQVKT